MALNIYGRIVPTDEEGFLTNPGDWSKNVAIALADEEGLDMTETHWGIVDYVRDYYEEHKVHPTMNAMVKDLGKSLGTHFNEEKRYVSYLYSLFPRDPVRQLCKIAGLPKPLSTEHDG